MLNGSWMKVVKGSASITTRFFNGHGGKRVGGRWLRTGVLVWLCALTGGFVYSGAPAQALTFHRYEAQLAEVPASAPVSGPLRGVQAMTAGGGGLYLVEGLDGQGGSIKYRADEFSSPASPSAPPAFVAQLPSQPGLTDFEPSNFDRGIALGDSVAETEMYVGTGSEIAVFAVGLCGLECASLQAKWAGGHTPLGSFTGGVSDVAVDNSTNAGDWAQGDVLVATSGAGGAPSVIDVFKPEAGGAEPSKVEAQIVGSGASQGESFKAVNSIAVSGFNGDVVVQDGESVDLFRPEVEGSTPKYVFVQKLAPPVGEFEELHNVVVDGGNDGTAADGEIYVEASTGIYEFGPEGLFRGKVTGAETPEKEWSSALEPRSIAVDPLSHRLFVGVFDASQSRGVVDVFGSDVVVPNVTTGPASNFEVQPSTHTWDLELTGTVDPLNEGPATCQFLWGTSTSLGHVAPCVGEGESSGDPIPSGGAPVSVHAQLSALAPDTTVFYRLQATNANGTNRGEADEDQTLETPGPGLHGQSVSEVSSSSARLEATINAHKAATSYYFEYGPTTAYGSDAPAPPGEAIGSGEGDVEVSQNVQQGLLAQTLYHYRVVAVSELAPGEFEEFAGPDATFMTQPAGGPLTLPDGRAWELVSPVDKRGALISPITQAGLVQAATSGGALTYVASLPTEAEPQGYSHALELGIQVLSSRGPGGWSSEDIALSHLAPVGALIGIGGEYRFFSEDLGLGVAESFGPFSAPEGEQGGQRVQEAYPEATERTPYIRHDTTCPGALVGCYEPLVTGAAEGGDVPEGTVFGGAQQSPEGAASFVGASPDANHVLLASNVRLTATPAPDGGLYEWSAQAPAAERLQLVSVLPESDGGAAAASPQLGRNGVERDAISENGSQIIWSGSTTEHGEVHLYLRETGAQERTVQLDSVQHGATGAGAPAPKFQMASSDGSRVFFTDTQQLTEDSQASGVNADLYEFDAVSDSLVDVTAAASKGERAAVQGLALGTSEDGSYVYFVANGVLGDGAERGATPGSYVSLAGAKEKAAETSNLYVAHEQDGVWTTSFIATLDGEDFPDWAGGPAEDLHALTARVSPNGEWLAFMSDSSLTGYDNRDAVSGMPDEEVYLYDASTAKLVCASCDPTGARPNGVQYTKLDDGLVGGHEIWEGNQWLASNIPGWTPYVSGKALYQSRFLSNRGRLFFNSSDALVPQDTDGNEDVYEYEPAGAGSCSNTAATFSGRAEGCIGLISSGVAHGESAFLDASETGSDVFFLTAEKLVPQDVDTALDVYDAHECTSQSPCPPAPVAQPSQCTSAASCRAAPAPQPSIFGASGSATFSGAGNIVPTPPVVVKPRSLTRAQKLTKALKACKRKPHKQRAECERQARRRYGPKKSAKARRKRGAR